MENSKVIVAIDRDTRGADLSMADFGLEADLFTAAPEFANLLS